MIESKQDFCFCTLALGQQYRILAQELGKEIEKYSPGTYFVVLTDRPKDFTNFPNILAFKHQQKGILKCYHDRRFVLKKALELFRVAIHIDSDTKLLEPIPNDIKWLPGITSGTYRNIIEHAQNKRSPKRQEAIKDLAGKLDISLENTNHVEESLFIIARDGGKEIEFIKQWDRIGRYLEMKGIHEGDGNAIGLAASKVGWTFRSEGWKEIEKCRKHAGITWNKQKKISKDITLAEKVYGFFDLQKQRVGYHYRLNRDRFIALKDFNFYYK